MVSGKRKTTKGRPKKRSSSSSEYNEIKRLVRKLRKKLN